MAAAPKLTQFDPKLPGPHDLLPGDVVYYLHEYTMGQNYAYSDTNQLIANLKKKPTRPQNELYWKGNAIAKCGAMLSAAVSADWVKEGTFVPVPCSKMKADPDYDDRMTRVGRLIHPNQNPDVREIVIQKTPLLASHEARAQGKPRPSIAELVAAYAIDEAIATPDPKAIAVVDDVLTLGRHFRAMCTVLQARWPAVPIVGLFVARAVAPNPFANLEDLQDPF